MSCINSLSVERFAKTLQEDVSLVKIWRNKGLVIIKRVINGRDEK